MAKRVYHEEPPGGWQSSSFLPGSPLFEREGAGGVDVGVTFGAPGTGTGIGTGTGTTPAPGVAYPGTGIATEAGVEGAYGATAGGGGFSVGGAAAKAGVALFDPISDFIFGGEGRGRKSGAFPGLKELGTEYQDFLMQRLTTPVTESEQYNVGVGAIRDALTTASATARQRLGDRATTGGFLDSGAVQSGLTAIDRGEAQALAQQISALTLGLMDRQEQNVLPYLSQGSIESTQIQGMNVGASTQARGQNMGLAANLAQPFVSNYADELFSSTAPFGGTR